jgi:hypothetical protein
VISVRSIPSRLRMPAARICWTSASSFRTAVLLLGG